MGFLVLSIACSCLILVLFRLAGRQKVELLPIIVLNYFVAGSAGHLISDPAAVSRLYSFQQAQWLLPAVIIGVLLIVMLFLMGVSSHRAGISVTSVASRMSVIVPITFSILYYSEEVFPLKLLGIGLALVAVALTSVRKSRPNSAFDLRFLGLPLVIFVGSGTIDTLIKFSQHAYITKEHSAAFTSLLFAFAFVLGLAVCVLKRAPPRLFFAPTTMVIGVALGLANYGSIYFLIRALEAGVLDSSLVFGLNNIGVVAVSAIIGVVFFAEKLLPLNWLGIALAFLSMCLLIIAG